MDGMILDRKVKNLDGDTVSEGELDAFRKMLRGRLIRPGDEEYEPSRTIFNSMIDRRPGLIVKCAGVADAIRSVNFARENRLLLAVRGGGHNVAGNALCDGGLVIDFSNMRGVRVDPKEMAARVEPGVTLGELLHETQVHGLATPVGVFSPTGIAGLTLGGGFGWLAGKHGLACDNLLSVDVVTADGRLLKASSAENADLFWAVRGGGGNFGVVTSFEFRLHPVDEVLAGVVAWPLAKAADVLRFFREFTVEKPDDLGIALGTGVLPQGPVVMVAACYLGSEEQGLDLLGPLRRFASPIADSIRRMHYKDVICMLDANLPPGWHNYWRSSYFREMSDELIETLIAQLETAVSPLSRFFIEILSGEAARKAPDETAFPIRADLYNLLFFGVWESPADTSANLEWVRSSWKALTPFLTSRVYVNYLSQEGEDRVRAAYGDNYDRLVALKKKYDPTNLFRVNQNIRPE